MPQLMATAVELNPQGIALIDRDREVSYAELDARSSALARVLIARGLGPGDLVAVAVPRSAESVLAVWAVAKAGAGFVPVDPDYPVERVRHMLGDSGAEVGLTVTAVRANLPDSPEWIALDADSAAHMSDEPVSFRERVRPIRATDVAYVIYTSGSTGLPKGVAVTHAGLAGFCAEQVSRYRLDAACRTLHFASPSFDASVLELLLALGAGSTMVIVPPGTYGGPELAQLVRTHAVTHAFVTPSALASMDPATVPGLSTVVAGGEALPAGLAQRWAVDGRRLHNGYGPTETTIMVNISDALSPTDTVHIGAPLPGVSEWILDEALNQVEVGQSGELYVTGAQVARGYHRRPGLTAARFVACPWAPQLPMYRTGDVVRRNADGTVEYLGRSDFQVKVRGFRIELGEIDAVLSAHPEVAFATTLIAAGPSGDAALVAYVKPAAAKLDPASVTRHAAHHLPAHMVPMLVIAIDEIPLTPVGKLDRAALPAPVWEAAAFRAPSTPVQRAVAEVFADVLGVEQIGLDDDFFGLGGNSLLATRAAARIRERMSVDFPGRLLFETPCVADLAQWLQPRLGSAVARHELAPQSRPERIPLSPAQQRMWFLNRFDPASTVNNIPVAVRLTGELDVAALQAAIADVVARHESLRTVYPELDGIGYQRILPAAEAAIDLTPITVAPDGLGAAVGEFLDTAFDVTAEVPFRVALYTAGPDQWVLVMVAHHISADGFSMGPLTRDVMLAYTARAAGREPGWTPPAVQYADYTLWQHAVLGAEDDPESVGAQQLSFWTRELSGLPDQLELPADRPRPPVSSGAGAVHAFAVDGDVHRGVAELARREGATVFMVAHAALAALLARLSGTADIAIGTPVAGRGERQLDDLIGMFVNTLVLRSRITGAETFAQLLAQVRETDLQAFGHAEMPFERLVEVVQPTRSTARHPLFQVMLSFTEGNSGTALELPGLRVGAVDTPIHTAKFDLQLSLSELLAADGSPAGMHGEFIYATDLFDESTVAGFAGRFTRLLSAFLADPQHPVGDVALLDRAERTRIVREWNATEHAARPAATLVSLFEAQAQRTPDATALTFEGARISYREFASRVNRLARRLIDLGVGPESLVALAMRRGPDLVVGAYAVHAAGGAYVPIDPDQPGDRIDYILDTAAPACVLTTAADAFSTDRAPVVDVGGRDVDAAAAAAVTDADRTAPLRPHHTAYVIFTSGSTGRPKGVAVTHAAIVNRLEWMQAEYGLTGYDAVLHKTPATFDVSVWELFWPLQVGAKLVVAAPDGHRDPSYLVDTIVANAVTTIHFVPSMLAAFLAETRVSECVSLRRVFASGEALPAGAAQRLRGLLPAAGVHNLYGPTEAAV
ncbi:MAG: amino acid adenylation domain-containing protein, partial [Streptomycetaceae bacterium]|nr:amino acid adenylation domain-containing protein [Streptomycetaceae bacterium]